MRRESKTADAVEVLSTTLQLTVSAALTDGFYPQEAYGAITGLVAWAIIRLPPEDRQGLLAEIVKSVAAEMAMQLDARRLDA